MKQKEMKEALKKEFVGKPFNTGVNSVSPYSVGYYIKNNFIPEAFRENVAVDVDKFDVTVKLIYKTKASYKYIPLVHVSVKRAKGKSHYNFFGSYCDWSVKDIEVTYCDFGKNLTLEEIYNDAMTEAKKSISEADEYEAEILKLVELLKTTTGLDRYDLRDRIDYIRNHWYSLADKVFN